MDLLPPRNGPIADRKESAMPWSFPPILLSVLFQTASPESGIGRVDFQARFKGFDACFILKEVGQDFTLTYNAERCRTRLAPCSTFKIFNSLAALDTGAVAGPDTLLKWDGTPQKRKECEQDHTLATAIRDSVLWYFQEVARRIGPERMKSYLTQADYGNCDISAGIDTFWLQTSLVISAEEQIRFMERLYTDKLPFKPPVMEQVRKMIVLRRGDGWVFSGKTGTGGSADKAILGWFVGHVRCGDRQFVFAANTRGDHAMGPATRDMVFAMLQDLGLIGSK